MLDIVLYRKPSREIQLVSEEESVTAAHLRPDMEQFTAMYRIVDLVSNAVDGEEKPASFQALLEGTLEALYRAVNRFDLLVVWFLLPGFPALGFEPSFCVVCSARR